MISITTKWIFSGILILLLSFVAFGDTSFNVNVGSQDFGIAVGNYDYLPYAAAPPLSMQFDVVLQEYGSWMTVARFGRVWRPYVDPSWRPYMQGHWVVTSYGPTWVGYEPWAWIGYHYGHWVLTREFGWVWIRGYDWNPGRVVWSTGPDMIGWMPAPPQGFSYAASFGSRYESVRFGLWVFIDSNRFGHDNYAQHCYRQDRVREVFTRQVVQVRTTPLNKVEIEKIVRRELKVQQVKTREISADHRKIKIVAVEGEGDQLRKHSKSVIENVITPGFARNNRSFVTKQNQNEKPQPDSRKVESNEDRKTTTPDSKSSKGSAASKPASKQEEQSDKSKKSDKGKKSIKDDKKKEHDDGPDRTGR